MKLNLDCVRDILLCVESNTGLRKGCSFVDFTLENSPIFHDEVTTPPDYQLDLLKKYEIDELIYHINYCSDADLIITSDEFAPYILLVMDLSPQGHEFIANIRNESVWEKVKSAFVKMGVASVPAAIEIASKIVSSMISSLPLS